MMTFAAASKDCLGRLVRLKRRVWQETYAGIYPESWLREFDEAGHAEKFRKAIADRESQVCLILVEGQDAGYFILGKPKHPIIGVAMSVNALYLTSDFQHQGLGSQVWTEILRRAKAAGQTVIGCRCNAHNHRALAFYKRRGGEEIALDLGHADRSLDQIAFLFRVQ